MINNVKDLELHLLELNDSVKNLVTNGLEATELHILLSELDKTLTRGKEDIVRENCCYTEALKNIGNLAKAKEHNDELQEMTEFAQFIRDSFNKNKSIHIKSINLGTRIKMKKKYILEFDDTRIGHYILQFKLDPSKTCNLADIELFRPNREYKNTRLVKALIENSDSYIESYSYDKGYLIIRNDTMNKFVIFTSKDGYHFNYLEPEEICIDDDRI